MRIASLSLIAGAVLACASTAWAQTPSPAPAPAPVTAEDRFMGEADAPVTVIEYASFSCSHCGDWNQQVKPDFKARYIDTGKVKLVYRDFPIAPRDLASVAAGVGRCTPDDKFFDVVDAFFAGHEALFAEPAAGQTRQDQALAWLSAGAAASGQPEETIATCALSAETRAAVDADYDAALAAGVTGTPTFFVNGAKVEEPTLEGLAAAIDPLLPPDRATP